MKSDLALKCRDWSNESAKTDLNYVKDSFKNICERTFSDYVAKLAKTDLNTVKDSISY